LAPLENIVKARRNFDGFVVRKVTMAEFWRKTP
jgi:hypothetical protein